MWTHILLQKTVAMVMNILLLCAVRNKRRFRPLPFLHNSCIHLLVFHFLSLTPQPIPIFAFRISASGLHTLATYISFFLGFLILQTCFHNELDSLNDQIHVMGLQLVKMRKQTIWKGFPTFAGRTLCCRSHQFVSWWLTVTVTRDWSRNIVISHTLNQK